MVLERRKYLVKVKTEELREYTVWKCKEIGLSGLRPCYKIFEIGRFARTLLKDTRHHWNPCSCKQWDKISSALHANKEKQLNKSYTQVKSFTHQNFPHHKVYALFLNLIVFKNLCFLGFFIRMWVMSAVITRHYSFTLWQHFCYFRIFVSICFKYIFNVY